jgi:hypothetical protein
MVRLALHSRRSGPAGTALEENFRRSLLISRGDLTTFIERPISAFFLAISVLPIAAQIYVWLRKPKVLAGEKPIEADIPTTRVSDWRVNWISVDRSTSGLLSLSVPIESERAHVPKNGPYVAACIARY